MSTVPELVTLQPGCAAVVRETVRMRQLPDFLGRVFHAVTTVAMDQGVEITGPPFAMYFGIPDESVEVAAGFPTAAPVVPSHGIAASEIPGGRAAQLVHEGSYDGLPDAYDQLTGWLAEQGLRPGEVMWESYLDEPPADAGETARTLITWPVAD